MLWGCVFSASPKAQLDLTAGVHTDPPGHGWGSQGAGEHFHRGAALEHSLFLLSLSVCLVAVGRGGLSISELSIVIFSCEFPV